MFGVAFNVRSFVNASIKQWNTELTASNQRLGNVKIRRGIFQGDSLSPLLFVLVMIPLTLVLRQTKASYELKKGGKKINHLLFMDDLKQFAKNEDQIDNLVNTVRIFSEDIKMEFGLPKCGVLIMKRGKVVKSEGISMPDGKMKSKLNRGNIILAINSRSVSIASYGAGIISWTKMELEKLDRRTRKLMTIYGAHHPKADVDRLYLQRCEGGRGLLGLEDCVQVEVHSLEKYLSTSKEKILKEVSRSRIIENNKYGRSK